MLQHFADDVLMLWRSQSAVVCGKHQNLCAELNYGYCMDNGILPARRLSGGGTVYHDLGNINFTFISGLQDGLEKAVNFKRFLEPIRNALQSMGVETEYSGRNDLLLNGKKISGNAEHVFQQKKKVLHHGTLLFDANLEHLGQALHPDGSYESKAVKSVRSQVVNIRSVLQETESSIFLNNIFNILSLQEHTYKYVFCEKDVDSINRLKNEKYATTEWIVHYSPKYTFKKPLGTELELEGSIHAGTLENLLIKNSNSQKLEDVCSDFLGKKLTESLSAEFALQLEEKLGLKTDRYILF